MARLDDIQNRIAAIDAEVKTLRAERETLAKQRNKLNADAHRKRIRRNKTLYLQRSFIWRGTKGPTHGDKVTVQVERYGKRAYGRKWVYVLYKGQPYSFRYADLTPNKPKEYLSQTNNLLAKVLHEAGM